MMMRTTLVSWFLLLTACCNSYAGSVTEYLKTMPDSICPLALASIPDNATDDYLHLTLSDVSQLEMRTLAAEGADTLICVVQTFKAPLAESDVRIYDTQWKEVRRITFRLADVIGDDAAKKYRTFFEPLLIEAHLSADNEGLILTVSHTNLSADEKKEIEGLKLQTSLNWNGKTFK